VKGKELSGFIGCRSKLPEYSSSFERCISEIVVKACELKLFKNFYEQEVEIYSYYGTNWYLDCDESQQRIISRDEPFQPLGHLIYS
jgi:hypothetical protein